MSATERWKSRVERHHEQSLSVQRDAPPGADFWRSRAASFRADLNATGDPVLDRLFEMVEPGTTVLDVGAGAGRLALPLALRCRHVTVVEPSESMLEQLREVAKEAEVHNITLVQAIWEEAIAPPADLVVCAHVVYGVTEIDAFIGKLASHAARRVAIFVFMESPPSRVAPFWKPVYGEERLNMPALPELLQVLWEMDIYPDVRMLPPNAPTTYESREEIVRQARSFLWITPGTEAERRLEAVAQELISRTPEGYAIRGVPPRRNALVTWQTNP